MATQHLLSTYSIDGPAPSDPLDSSRSAPAGLVRPTYLDLMTTTTEPQTTEHAVAEHLLDPVISLSQLAVELGVSLQTLYDLRSQGRGPRGFRVGRELRFRVSEVDAWLAQMEADDAERHPRQGD